MKIEINLKEIFIDEDQDGSIQEALKADIIYETVSKIKKEYKDKIEEQIKKIAEERIKELLSEEYKKEFKKQFYETKIKENSYTNAKKISFKEFVKNKIEEYSDCGYNDITDLIEKLADKNAKNLKKRYDLMFASQIVNKLGEQNLLSDKKIKELL